MAYVEKVFDSECQRVLVLGVLLQILGCGVSILLSIMMVLQWLVFEIVLVVVICPVSFLRVMAFIKWSVG